MNIGNTYSARKWGEGHLSGSLFVGIQARPPHHIASQPLARPLTRGHLLLPRNHFRPQERPKKSNQDLRPEFLETCGWFSWWGLGSRCDVGPGDLLMKGLPSSEGGETPDGKMLVEDVVL